MRVAGGIVSEYLGTTHSTRNNGPCGAILVQLAPFAETPNSGSEYKLWMTLVEQYDTYLTGFWGFQAKHSKTDNFKIKGPGRLLPQCAIRGYRFFDHREDGIWNPSVDPLEVAIPGWRIELWQNGVLDRYTFTDDMGRYTFLVVQGNTYTVREVAPGGFIGDNIPGAIWLALTPREGVVVADAAEVAGPDFGNLSFEVKVGVGRTKGFWHNQNGRVLLEACDPVWRAALTTHEGSPLCLRRNISSSDSLISIYAPSMSASFPDAADGLADFLVGEPALGHLGFILSTQVAATVLNHTCGYMQFTVYVDRYKTGVLISLDDMLRGVQGLLCDPRAGESGPNDPYPAYRDQIANCLTEFGEINNSGDPNNDQTVYGSSSEPSDFESPY